MVYISEIKKTQHLFFEGPYYHNLNPRILKSNLIDDLPENYWEFRSLDNKLHEFLALKRNSTDALERMNKYINTGKILDFGCGWGFFLHFASENGWEPFGIEPLIGHSIYARSKFGLNVITDTLHADSFIENFFDAITAFQVFEHLPNPGEVIDILYHFHKSAGILLIEVPNINTWSVRFLKKFHRHFTMDHINFFSENTLEEFLRRHGYQVIETYTPRRYMTLKYLVHFWFRKFFPSRFIDSLLSLGNNQFWEKIIAINVRDILGVIAKKV